MLHLIVFSVFGLVCVAGAINLLVQRHPINSALSLVVVMGSLAVEYLLLGAEFVAAVQVIVYAGAIMVLFVFVIMLLNAGVEDRTKGSRVAMLFGIPGVLNRQRAGGMGSVATFRHRKRCGWRASRTSKGNWLAALSRFSLAVRSHVGACSHCDYGRGSSSQPSGGRAAIGAA